MSVRVELTYEMSKALGRPVVEVEASTVGEAMEGARAGFDPETWERLTARTAIALNGVLVRYRDRLATRLDHGDVVSFVKAAAGG